MCVCVLVCVFAFVSFLFVCLTGKGEYFSILFVTRVKKCEKWNWAMEGQTYRFDGDLSGGFVTAGRV